MRVSYKAKISGAFTIAVTAAVVLFCSGGALAGINGISGQTSFNFTAKAGELSIADGGSVHFWGYEDLDGYEGVGLPQYPGPTLILNQNDMVSITLTSQLPFGKCTSIVFPGHRVTASGGSEGILTNESCGPGDTVTYQFTATEPGTYMYYSGTEPDLQVEMGLVGAIIVRPAMGANYAYNHADTSFDYETLFLLTSLDPNIHALAEQNRFNEIDLTLRWPVYWFINGRTAPDDLVGPFVAYLPHQPYDCTPRMTPGDRMLVRIIGADQDQHPLHLHGNHYYEIARYGRLLSSNGSTPDLQRGRFTTLSVPGQTVDAIFTWTGEKLGWDIYGTPADGMPDHECIDNDGDGYGDEEAGSTYDHEYCDDHGKPFPVVLPENQDLAFGGWWSGSPFMGGGEPLPPGEGGLNPNNGFFFMWHSHTEKELTNWDIFPGGMMTMMVVEPPGTVID
ncbi:MAG: multicopper oxidase domain-containing protein [Desulfobulbaceae bacterium]|nr:multicopper oxidase domain-containing protein [Desulfobulbaceae bacterium]